MTEADPGPLIRLFGLTGGRARPQGEKIDLAAIVTTSGVGHMREELAPEHAAVLALCAKPTPVADVAATLRLPVNITRVILGDLRRDGLVAIDAPRSVAETIDRDIYREVLDGLRSL